MVSASEKVIALFIGSILAAYLIPVGLSGLAGQVVADNLTAYGGYNWSGSDVIIDPAHLALWGLLSIAVIVAVVVLFFKQVM